MAGSTQTCSCGAGEVGTQMCNSTGSAWGGCGNCAPVICTPNATQSCNCGTWSTGQQTCNANGTSWGSCNNCLTQLGGPCSSSQESQCASDDCNGVWCTQLCASDSNCSSRTTCAELPDGFHYCFPNCTSNSDCSVYGSNFTCQQGFDASGFVVTICGEQ
jgi:hypothetical protein